MKRIVFFFLILMGVNQLVHAQLITCKAPAGAMLNKDFTVKVRQQGKEWQPVSVYAAHVTRVVDTRSMTENTSVAYFDFSGVVEISITYNKGSIKGARVRPLSYGITPKINGNTINFSLNRPRNISIEVNGDIFHNLELFANTPETFRLSPADTGVVYFGPGIHRAGTITMRSNQTVYIAAGAIVQGQILINKAVNVHVLGRGILTQLPVAPGIAFAQKYSGISKTSRNDELTINNSKNVEISGIIIMPHKYSILIGQSQGVTINNIKSFSSEGNADGIDIFCSSDISISNVFMRNSDDCLAIYGHRWAYYGNTKNIVVKNSAFWADVAHPILIGTHGDAVNPDTLEYMKFENIDILDQHENQIDYQGCMALDAGDDNLIRNIIFNNIRVENIRKGQLFNLRVMYNHKYNTSPGQCIENILFKNISYTGNRANMSVISGYDDNRMIKNVDFENLTINHKIISDNMPDKPGFYKTGDMANILIGEHVEGIKFIRTKN